MTRLGAGAGEDERGASNIVDEFKKFLKELQEEGKHSIIDTLIKALSFVENVRFDFARAEMPIAYKVFSRSIEFVWLSGLTLTIRLENWGLPEKPDWQIRAYFDHLARPEAIE
ncbi:MAG: hypothetical protein ACXQTR_05650 [Candidatus Methanospirareceae archaeon]